MARRAGVRPGLQLVVVALAAVLLFDVAARRAPFRRQVAHLLRKSLIAFRPRCIPGGTRCMCVVGREKSSSCPSLRSSECDPSPHRGRIDLRDAAPKVKRRRGEEAPVFGAQRRSDYGHSQRLLRPERRARKGGYQSSHPSRNNRSWGILSGFFFTFGARQGHRRLHRSRQSGAGASKSRPQQAHVQQRRAASKTTMSARSSWQYGHLMSSSGGAVLIAASQDRRRSRTHPTPTGRRRRTPSIPARRRSAPDHARSH
jgi:hypothetical protein